MSTAWFFSKDEVCRVTVIRRNSVEVVCLMDGREASFPAGCFQDTFELARVARCKEIGQLIDRESQNIVRAQSRINRYLGLLEQSLSDDEGAHVDDEGDSA